MVLATLGCFAAGPPANGIRVTGGTPAHQEMAKWAISRFGAEGLVLPALDIRFHLDRKGCRDRLGYYADGVADLCYVHLELMASRTLMHEMAHGWLDVNMSVAERERFLRLRGLDTWNDEHAAWDDRGYEQAAEIMAWALGDQRNDWRPMFANNSRGELVVAYETLTGNPLPDLEPHMTWEGRAVVSGGTATN